MAHISGTQNTNDSENGEDTWQDILYEKGFNEEYEGLRRRLAAEKMKALDSCEQTQPAQASTLMYYTDFIANIEALLKTLYDMDGSDWLGRGEVQSINLSATIAAYESFISDLKAARI
ncbi:MAG: hypothetical protein Ta2B_12320 [Termitinemataceae bacterium]|nr:MAG: hypothetical protein Ta2B_12320 [Termitinemataceae bacterium]